MNTCRSCAAPVEWVEMVPSGKRIPLDPADVDVTAVGAIIVVGRYGYSLKELTHRLAERRAISTAHAADVIAETYGAHLSHFASCPDAAKHRR